MKKESEFESLAVKKESKQKFKQLKPYQLKDYEFFDVILKYFEEQK